MRLLPLALAGFALCGSAAFADEGFRELSPGLFLLPGQLSEDRSPDGNSIVIRGSEGLLVVDTGRNDAHSQTLLAFVLSAGLPVRAVVNSHWHLDHIGGNAIFKRAIPGVRILASPALDTALAGFHADNRKQLEQYLATMPNDAPIRPRLQSELDTLKLDRDLAETDPLTEPMVLNLGGRAVEINLMSHAVTEGDAWIRDPASRTVVAGDLVTLPVPLLDTACPEGWQASLRTLGDADFDTLVPGHGPPLTKAQFLQWRGAYDQLLACSANPGAKPKCIDGWIENLRPFIDGDQEPYARELLAYYFDQSLIPSAAGRARWCAK